MLTVALGSVQAVDAAPKKVKITWNANGGKIGTANTKATTVTKGAKVGKLPKTPTKVGYTFKGWYTKKSGGTKITKATKVNKKVTHYAQWKKKNTSRVLNAEEKKLVGVWRSYTFDDNYMFTDKGTFVYYVGSSSVSAHGGKSGNFKVSGGKITFSNIVYNEGYYPKTQIAEYKLDTVGKNGYLMIRSLTYSDMSYLDFNYYTTYSKMS